MMDLNFANPHFFSAILDDLPHRFVLVQECECLDAYQGFRPPRFSIGAVNATQDPRSASPRQLLSVGVDISALRLPRAWLMAHQYLYLVHENTDRCGWQYRTSWPSVASSSGNNSSAEDTQWSKEFLPTQHCVRRRVWMTTLVPRTDLVRAKRLLAENLHLDRGAVRLQGELFRYEKGTLTKSWSRRRVVLHHNRIEFFSNSSKKGEISLRDCEVRVLSADQCPARGGDKGKHFPFSVRSSTGSVGVLLDTDDPNTRRQWVLAIQYQMAVNAQEMNFAPLANAPPTGADPAAQCVSLSADLKLLGKDGRTWLPRHFQLLPREIVCFDEQEELRARIFVEQATVVSRDESDVESTNKSLHSRGSYKSHNNNSVNTTNSSGTNSSGAEEDKESDLCRFEVRSASGISLSLATSSAEIRREWVRGVRAQVQAIENHKLRAKTTPREELQEDGSSASERVRVLREEHTQSSADTHAQLWTAPPVEGENEAYLQRMLSVAQRNDPDHFEFSADLEIYLNNSSNNNNNNSNNGKASLSRSVSKDKPSSAMNTLTKTKTTTASMPPSPVEEKEKTPPQIMQRPVSALKTNNTANSTSNTATIKNNETITRVEVVTDTTQQSSASLFSSSSAATTTATVTEIETATLSTTHNSASIRREAISTNAHSSSTLTTLSVSSSLSAATDTERDREKEKDRLSAPPSTSLFASLRSTSSKHLDTRRLVINPRFMLSCLKNINHRFVLVLECEFRRDAPQSVSLAAPPRFTVGGPRASKDPRTVPLSQLLEITNRNPEIQFPSGWFMLHPYVYIVQQNTDDNGWQYRSSWSDGNLSSTDEPWADVCDASRCVRRRMWMTTVAKKDDLVRAKRLLADALNKPREDALCTETLEVCRLSPEEELSLLSPQTLAGRWEKCTALLYHRKLEFYNGHDKLGEASLTDCEALLVSFDQCGRKHALALQHPLGSPRVLLCCTDESARLRWLQCLEYQRLLLSPELDFDPVAFSPPTGEPREQRVLLCGDLQLCTDSTGTASMSSASSSSKGNKWETLTVQLTEETLRCVRRDGSLYGQLLLDGCTLRLREEEREFTLRTLSGHVVHVRTDDGEARQSWTQTIRRVAEVQKLRKRSALSEMSMRERARQFQDALWLARERESDLLEDELFLHEKREKYRAEMVTRWPHAPCLSPHISLAQASPSIGNLSRKHSEKEKEREKSSMAVTLSQSSSPQVVVRDIKIDRNTVRPPVAPISAHTTNTVHANAVQAMQRFSEEDEDWDADFDLSSSLPSKLSLVGRQRAVSQNGTLTSTNSRTVSNSNVTNSNNGITSISTSANSNMNNNNRNRNANEEINSTVVSKSETITANIFVSSSMKETTTKDKEIIALSPSVAPSATSFSSSPAELAPANQNTEFSLPSPSTRKDEGNHDMHPLPEKKQRRTDLSLTLLSTASFSFDEGDDGPVRRKNKPCDVELRAVDERMLSPPKDLLGTAHELSSVELRHVESPSNEKEKDKPTGQLPVKVQLRPINIEEIRASRSRDEADSEKAKSPLHRVVLRPVRRESDEKLSSVVEEEKDIEEKDKPKVSPLKPTRFNFAEPNDKPKVTPLDPKRFSFLGKKDKKDAEANKPRPISGSRVSRPEISENTVEEEVKSDENLSFQQKIRMFAQKAKAQAPVFPTANSSANTNKRTSFPFSK